MQAEEYPRSLQELQQRSPDECIPEFYLDASLFRSRHTQQGLEDLQLPTWASSPEEFIQAHR